MKETFKVKTTPLARTDSMICGGKYRITVLTAGLLRLEYHEDGRFVNEATQMVWNRDFPTPEFTVTETDEQLEIHTARVHLAYNKKEFSSYGLSIRARNRRAWHYGDQPENLGGTVRTLDEVDGACPLEPGILARVGYAVLDDSRSLLITENSEIRVRVSRGEDLYFFGYDQDYREALQDFYRLTGATPMLPRYALGNWWSRYYSYTETSYLELMDRFAAEKIPFSVAVLDMGWHLTEVDPKYGEGWTGYTWNRELFPDPPRFLKELHDRNMKVTLNLHPSEGVQPYEEMYGDMADAMGMKKEQQLPVGFDFSDERFIENYFEILHHPYEKMGVDFWWIDWQQGGNTKVEGLDPLWMLNHDHFLDSGREGKRPMILSRYAGPGSHRYPVGFSGDAVVSWESLQFQPYFTASASNIGYGWWSHDIGGHMFGSRDDELEARWYQFGVFSPIMRLHSTQNEFMGKEPWRFSEEVHQNMNFFLRLRHQLIPYLYTMNHRSWKEGLPLILPLYYENAAQNEAYQVPNGYYFGTELLAFPVTTPRIPELHAAQTDGWLPAGTYVDIFTGMIYSSDANRKVRFFRGLESLPVLAKAGGILPMTDDIFSNPDQNPQSLCIRVYAGANGAFTLYEDDNITCAYETGNCAETRMELNWAEKYFRIDPVQGNAALIPEEREITLEFWGVTEGAIHVLEGASETECEVRYEKHKNILSVHLPVHKREQALTIRLAPETALADNHTEERIYEFLEKAELSYSLKEELMNAVRRERNPVLLAETLYAIGADERLMGVLLEILGAK